MSSSGPSRDFPLYACGGWYSLLRKDARLMRGKRSYKLRKNHKIRSSAKLPNNEFRGRPRFGEVGYKKQQEVAQECPQFREKLPLSYLFFVTLSYTSQSTSKSLLHYFFCCFDLEAQQRYSSYRAILVAIESQNSFVLVFHGVWHKYRAIRSQMGYRTDVSPEDAFRTN